MKQRREAAALKKREAKGSATPMGSNIDPVWVDSSVNASLALPGAGKPSSCSSTVTTQAQPQASSAPCNTCSLRPWNISAAASSNRSAGDAPIPMVTLGSLYVDPKSQG